MVLPPVCRSRPAGRKIKGGEKADLPLPRWLCRIRALIFTRAFFGSIWGLFCLLAVYFFNIAKRGGSNGSVNCSKINITR